MNPSFIKGNMASGVTYLNAVLTDEQAFDVAAFVNGQPWQVKAHLEADFPTRKNKPVDAAFGPNTPGFSAEQHMYGPRQPIQTAREQRVSPPHKCRAPLQRDLWKFIKKTPMRLEPAPAASPRG